MVGACLIAWFKPFVWLPFFPDLRALRVAGFPTPLLVVAARIVDGWCVHVVTLATFVSGFAMPAPCWPRRSCRNSLGWHRVTLVVVVSLVAGVVLPGDRAVVIAGIRTIAVPRSRWRSRRHHPWDLCRCRHWRSHRHRRCRSRCGV